MIDLTDKVIAVIPNVHAFVSGFAVATLVWIVLGFVIAKKSKLPIV